MRQHRYVTAVDGAGGCTHPLRQEAFWFRLHRPIVFSHDVPARLRLPGDAGRISTKQVGHRRIMRGPYKFLLFFREVSREAHDAFRTHPDAAVRNFDILEHIGEGEFLLLALRGFVGVRGKCGDVDKPNDTVIGSCGRDHASTIGVANQDGRVADPS